MSVPPLPRAPSLLITADAVGGVWTYALDLGRELVRSGVRVTLAVIGPAPDADGRHQAEAAGLDVRHLGGELDWTADSEEQVTASAASLFALTAELRPNLVHLNSPALAAFGSFGVPVLAACHSCVATWWSAVKGDAPLPADLAWRVQLTARSYAAVDALLAPSRAFAEATQVTYALPVAPQVVLNGCCPLILPPWGRGTSAAGGGGCAAASGVANPLSPLRGQLPQRASIHDISVLTAGRLWDEGKDVVTLDRAIGRAGLSACAAGPTAGPDGQGIRLQHARSLGRLPHGELSKLLSRLPIFVSPSLYEPFGLAVLEAAQAGCPLVLSDIATFRELWDGAAVFFPPGDDLALATQLEALADPDRRAALGEAARARAARYTAAAMADATLQLYARLSPAFARAEAAA